MISDTEKILLDMAYLDRGLVPNGSTLCGPPTDQLKLAFVGLNDCASRKIKRRYRKHLRKAVAWRKRSIRARSRRGNTNFHPAIRDSIVQEAIARFLRSLGMPYIEGVEPTPGQRLRRRVLVRDYFRYRVLNT